MKIGIYLGLVFTMAFIVLSLACNQPIKNSNQMMNANSAMNTNGMNHNSMPMNSNMPMNHSEMKSSPNAATAPYDLQFIDTMTAHHQGAIEMSKEALQKSEKAEIKTLANQIIKAQEAEIKMMSDWKTKWSK